MRYAGLTDEPKRRKRKKLTRGSGFVMGLRRDRQGEGDILLNRFGSVKKVCIV